MEEYLSSDEITSILEDVENNQGSLISIIYHEINNTTQNFIQKKELKGLSVDLFESEVSINNLSLYEKLQVVKDSEERKKIIQLFLEKTFETKADVIDIFNSLEEV